MSTENFKDLKTIRFYLELDSDNILESNLILQALINYLNNLDENQRRVSTSNFELKILAIQKISKTINKIVKENNLNKNNQETEIADKLVRELANLFQTHHK